MYKIGVLLSGCGVMDGSEIHEAVITLLAIDKEGLEYICIAPDKEQTQVINHLTNQPTNEKRNILVESARIARGNIKDIKSIRANEIDALIMPGGFGAACNLSSFAKDGANAQILPEVENLLQELHKLKKPIGAICIAPVILARVLGKTAVGAFHETPLLTIGTDKNTASALEQMGARHINKNADEVAIDGKNLIVTTPAYMLGKGPKEVEAGVTRLVKAVIELIKQSKLNTTSSAVS
ncbi:MAG: isoprenoid biosynthesis protein ElbB [Candidatus Melainabacteria bacterium RIFCSPLOWO2_02_FULL_35_15]|nr:MAG: isoprenoid biosynthesis protein ElbB [Candidatus Melainabacteria bacterium RIFCSPLOWO2_12_FULL_35_11]OGI14281.1 MAG: isoprenoid biosynthesis protein ElbB [Candidatus Melainabacteria bacterium RIFCSPLOWO2_02_FULL_35_15]